MYETTLHLHGKLRDFLPKRIRQETVRCRFDFPRSVKDLIESYGVPHTEIQHILVNGTPVDFDYLVQDGDALSAYPVTHFPNAEREPSLQPVVADIPRLICDDHLEKLARRLRLLGYDVWFEKGVDDAELATIAHNKNRILLTRDRRLLMRKIVDMGIYIWSDDPEEQVLEVLLRLRGTHRPRPFGRCTVCNGVLTRIPAASPEYRQAVREAPPRVRNWRTEFFRCDACKRLYWKGTHYEKLRGLIEGYTESAKRVQTAD